MASFAVSGARLGVVRAGGGGGGGGGPAARSGGVDLPSVLFRRKDSFSREAPSLARLVLEHGALTLSLSLSLFLVASSLSLCVGATCSVTDFDGKRRSPDRLQLTASRACVIPPILLLSLDPYVMCVCTLLGTWVHRSDHCF